MLLDQSIYYKQMLIFIMKYQKGELPDQPEAKINVLEEYLTKQIQYRTKGRVLKYLTECNMPWLFNEKSPLFKSSFLIRVLLILVKGV